MKYTHIAIFFVIASFFGIVSASAKDNPMGFFVTSTGLGKGGDLGGIVGADAHCQALAASVGAGNRQWRAYLSTEEDGKRGISARDRIGSGPWYNAKGVLIAENITEIQFQWNRRTSNRLVTADTNPPQV